MICPIAATSFSAFLMFSDTVSSVLQLYALSKKGWDLDTLLTCRVDHDLCPKYFLRASAMEHVSGSSTNLVLAVVMMHFHILI